MDYKWRVSTHNAYLAQFMGDVSRLKITPIWKAKVDPKCRFFLWTLFHRKNLSVENLQKKGWQHDPIYKLCNGPMKRLTIFALMALSQNMCGTCFWVGEISQWLVVSFFRAHHINGGEDQDSRWMKKDGVSVGPTIWVLGASVFASGSRTNMDKT